MRAVEQEWSSNELKAAIARQAAIDRTKQTDEIGKAERPETAKIRDELLASGSTPKYAGKLPVTFSQGRPSRSVGNPN